MPNTKHITVDQVIEVLADLQTKADGRFRALAAKILEADLDTALATKINGKADQTALNAVSGQVDTLIGSETGDNAKSVRTISAEEVAKVVAGAPASFDTLKELADWILNDTTGAAKMANDISALKTKTTLGTHEVGGEQVEYASVKDYVEAYVDDVVGGAYTAGDGIDIDSYHEISLKLTPGNGLDLDANGNLSLAAADEYNNGAMTTSDKEAIANLQSDVSDLETDVSTLNGKTTIDDVYGTGTSHSGIMWMGDYFAIYPDESYDRAIKFNDTNGSVYINTLYAPGEDDTPEGTFDTSVGIITYDDFMKFHGKQEFINSSNSITVEDTDSTGMNPYFEASLKVDANNANGLNVTSNGVGITPATTSAAGAMSAADKTKLDGADVTPYTGSGAISVLNHAISASNATTSAAGLMSSADKTKLDSFEEATATDIAAIKATIWPSS